MIRIKVGKIGLDAYEAIRHYMENRIASDQYLAGADYSITLYPHYPADAVTVCGLNGWAQIGLQEKLLEIIEGSGSDNEKIGQK
jgi:hypothetical protein